MPSPGLPRAVASALFIGAGLAVLAPALAKRGFDDFPFSPYGMFSENQDENTTVTQAVPIIGGKPASKALPPRFLGTDEVLQARATLMKVAGKKRDATALCKRIAERVAAEPKWAAVVEAVEIRTVTYESIPYFENPDIPPKQNRVHARCDVPR